MEDEIDLRVYLSTLIRYWWLILALTIGAGLVAFIVRSSLPPRYQATAVVFVTRPLFKFQLSGEILGLQDTVNAQLTSKVGADLATSDAALAQLLDKVGSGLPPQENSLTALKGMLKATASGDPPTIKLTAVHRDPQRAAEIANAWANVHIQQVNELYGASADSSRYFEDQMAAASTRLDNADQALVDFYTRSELIALQMRLSASQTVLTDCLGKSESLKLSLLDVQGLQDRLSRQPADAIASGSYDVSALMLQASVLSAEPGAFQFQLSDTATLGHKTVGQQIAYLNDLSDLIKARQTEVDKQAIALIAEVTTLRGRVQKLEAERVRLALERDLAQSVYMALARKVEETRIASQDAFMWQAQLASAAVAPDQPMGGRLTTTVIAAGIGLLAGAMGAFAIEYFRQPRARPAAPQSPK